MFGFKVRSVLLAAVVSTVTSGIFVAECLAVSPPPIKIGLLLCLTGECAADGSGSREGAELAALEINELGGVIGRRIEFVVQDTAEAISGAKVISAYRQLRTDKEIKFLIGPSWTPGGLSLAPVASKDADVIVITPTLGAKEFHLTGDNLFNLRGTDEIPTRLTAKRAIERGFKHAAIFSSQQPWESQQAKYFAEEFVKLGGKIASKVEPLPTTTTLGTEALRTIGSKPDVIFFANLVQQAIAAKELRKLGWNGEKLAANVDETRLKESEGALEGVQFMTFQKPSATFVKKYQARYQKLPELAASTGYDAVYAYAKAIESADKLSVPEVKAAMSRIAFSGASGEIRFDQEGCVAKKPQLWVVKNGSLTLGSG